MGLIGEKPPRNMEELKEEIKLWPRIDPRSRQHVKISGFVRNNDFNHIYKGIEEDVNTLIDQGLLIEFKENDLHNDMIKDNQNKWRKENDKYASILYSVDISSGVEPRGTHNLAYPQESLNILSQLWNDPGSKQTKDFNWQEIIENNELLDE
jgi:hypothetical protein